MIFNKVTVLSAVIAGLAFSSLNTHAADPVTLTITGNIIASPCEVKSDSVNKTIDLGQNIQASDLSAAASSTSWVNFDINLEKCPAGTTSATMTMHGTQNTTNPEDMYKNTGTATNVAVQLQSQAGDQLGDGKSITGTIASNAYTYKLKARAYSASGGATPGTIAAVVTATFVYQ